uniref:Uncharacterized protein n=1 Tax=Cannabis sativa TaxID=3483 RepID=A0A803QJP9_CANSA
MQAGENLCKLGSICASQGAFVQARKYLYPHASRGMRGVRGSNVSYVWCVKGSHASGVCEAHVRAVLYESRVVRDPKESKDKACMWRGTRLSTDTSSSWPGGEMEQVAPDVPTTGTLQLLLIQLGTT